MRRSQETKENLVGHPPGLSIRKFQMILWTSTVNLLGRFARNKSQLFRRGQTISLLVLTIASLSAVSIRTPAETSPQAGATPTGTEIQGLDALATLIVEKLNNSSVKIVAVNHFAGQKLFESHNLSLELSKAFALALTKSAANIQVYENARLVKALQDKNWMAIDIEDPDAFRAIAYASGVQAIVNGIFKISGDSVELSLMVIKVSGEKIATFKTKIAVPHVVQTLQDSPVRDPQTGVYLAGVGGVTSPSCQFCPYPQFPPEAEREKITYANVKLRVTVRTDGRVADLCLIKSGGYSLDENSAELIQRWRLLPAHLPDGTPISSRLTIEVIFKRSASP
ncbi:MAG: energy transducer TonB [Acidipila sp.]|nr:energy transducer TonB [Acidipila sp.]